MKSSGIDDDDDDDDDEIIHVFIDSNLGTHLALPVPGHITAGDLKSKLRQEHLSCFPSLGEIEVHALMVKWRSHFYHLPDAMPIKIMFLGLSGTWLLHIHATRLQNELLAKTVPPAVKPTGPTASQKLSPKLTQDVEVETVQLRENPPSISGASDITESSRSEIIAMPGVKNWSSFGNGEQPEVLTVPASSEKIMRTKMADDTTKNIHTLQSLTGPNTKKEKQIELGINMNYERSLLEQPLECKEAPSANVSKEISVTGIISRYFPDCDEVNSCRKKDMHELENLGNNEFTCSSMRASEYWVNHSRAKMSVESDTDTLCSINNAAADVSKVTKETKRSYRRTRKAASSEVRNKASRSKRMIQTPTPPSEKLQIGKKLVQAANNISISSSRRKSLNPLFISRCGNMSTPQSGVLVRNIAFELDNSEE